MGKQILIDTLWDQSGKITLPGGTTSDITYNEYCPCDLVQGKMEEKHSVTGCTNTADSQVIYYWLGKTAGKQISFTAKDDDFYTVRNFSNQEKKDDLSTTFRVEAKDNEDFGALGVSELNELLAERDLNSGEFIAALNFFCGLKNHSCFSTTLTTSAGAVVEVNLGLPTLYSEIGFVSYLVIDTDDKTSFIQKDEKTYLTDLALSIIRENLDYGEPIRIDSKNHSMILDGYRLNEETEAYEYHVNMGWGKSDDTTWYTVDELNDPKEVGITAFYIDLTPALYVKVTNGLDKYAAGSMERGAQRINNARTETTVTVDTSAMNNQTVQLSKQWLVKSKANVVFDKVETDFIFSSGYGLYSTGSTITVNELSSALIVNNANGAVAYGSDKLAGVTLNEGSIFAGGGVKSETVLEALEGYKDFGYEAVSELAAKATGIAFSGGEQDDTITIKNNSVVMGDIAMNAGRDNNITIETGSMWIGNLKRSDVTVKFDIESATKNAMILSSESADSFVNSRVSLKASIDVDEDEPLTGAFSLIQVTSDASAFQNASLTLEYVWDDSLTKEITLSVDGEKKIIGDMEYSLVADDDLLLLSAGWIKRVTKEQAEVTLDRYYADVIVETGTASLMEGNQSFIAHVALSDGVLDSQLDDLQIGSLEVTGGQENALKNELIQFHSVEVASDSKLEVSGEQFQQFLSKNTDSQIDGTLIVDDDADIATLQSLLAREDMKSLHFTGNLEKVSQLSFHGDDVISWVFDGGMSGTAKNDQVTVQENTEAFLDGGIDLLGGNNKLVVEKDAEFVSGGAMANVQTITVASGASVTFNSTLSDLEKLVIASGSAKSGVAGKTVVTVIDEFSGEEDKATSISAGNYSAILLVAGLSLSGKNDTITVNRYSSLEISGNLDMGEGNNSLKVGENSFCAIGGRACGIRTLDFEGGENQQMEFTVNGNYTATDGNDTLSFGTKSKANIGGALSLGEGSDTISLGSNSSLVIGGLLSSKSGTGKITIGEESLFSVQDDIVSGSGKTTVTMKKNSQFYAQNLSGISSFSMDNLSVSDYEERASGNYSVRLASLDGTGNADSVSVGNGAVFCVDDEISLGSGNDKLSVGKCAKLSAVDVDLGAGKNTLTLNSSGLFSAFSMSGVNKLDVRAGKVMENDDGKDTRALWSELFVAKNLDLTAGNDTITTNKYSNVNIAGLINFKDGHDTIKIGSFAEAVLKADDISSLSKMTVGKNSKVWLSSELAEFYQKSISEKSRKKQNICVYDIGAAKDGIAQNFVSYAYETGDNTLKSARSGLNSGETLGGWIDNDIDEADYYAWENFTTASWSDSEDLLFTQYNKDNQVLGTSSGKQIKKMADASAFSITFKDKTEYGAVIYTIALS